MSLEILPLAAILFLLLVGLVVKYAPDRLRRPYPKHRARTGVRWR